jgi:hypothetical protein
LAPLLASHCKPGATPNLAVTSFLRHHQASCHRNVLRVFASDQDLRTNLVNPRLSEHPIHQLPDRLFAVTLALGRTRDLVVDPYGGPIRLTFALSTTVTDDGHIGPPNDQIHANPIGLCERSNALSCAWRAAHRVVRHTVEARRNPASRERVRGLHRHRAQDEPRRLQIHAFRP